MATRWKRENPDTLIMLHAHNRWSQFYDFVMRAAEELGIPVCVREYANHFDASRDREYIVPQGTKRLIMDLAHARQRESWF